MYNADARKLGFIKDNSVHLVLTSPPYWTLKDYRVHPEQMGYIADYATFLDELDRVWKECYRVLVPGGRLVCVVGDAPREMTEKAKKGPITDLRFIPNL